jgi:hypothetical protein
MLPGTFFHFSNDSCRILIEQFMAAKPKVKYLLYDFFQFKFDHSMTTLKVEIINLKECLLDVYRKLCEIYPLNDTNKDKKTFRINAESIKTQIKNGLR